MGSGSRLVGRKEECAHIDRLLGRARHGQSGALILRGEPGIGKSALLDYAIERAEGMTVLRAVGLESASELAYVTLRELLEPIAAGLDRLSLEEAQELRAAFALTSDRRATQYAVAAATLSLLAAVADERAVLCVVDDAHWVDRASADALVFAARRLEAEGVVMLFAARRGEGAFAAPGPDTRRKETLVRVPARSAREVHAPEATRTLHR